MADTAASGVVQLDHVSVSYGRNQAMQDVTAVFQTGAVGLLGPNGAGKEHDATSAPRIRSARPWADACVGV